MPDTPGGKADGTLYEVLAQAVPRPIQAGQTIFSIVKETVDRDQEDTGTSILLER